MEDRREKIKGNIQIWMLSCNYSADFSFDLFVETSFGECREEVDIYVEKLQKLKWSI